MHELVIIGGGSGNSDYILPIAVREAENADCVIASERFLKLLRCRRTIPLKNIEKLLEDLPGILEKERAAVIVSGDPLLYSLCRTIKERYPQMKSRVIPGIGSLQILGCEFGITMEDARIYSIHGRDYTDGKIAYAVSENKEVFFLCSSAAGPVEISKALLKYGLDDCEIFVGENLTYETRKLYKGKPADFVNGSNPGLCVAAVRNRSVDKYIYPALLPDSAFYRNSSPMTKEEVRAVIISKLRLKPDSIVWDIGAGTGSISVECSRFCRYGEVYSIEYKPSAIDALEKNRELFSLDNMNIIEGRAEDIAGDLPEPDIVFIGGSGKKLNQIMELLKTGKRKRIVLSAVSVETQNEAFRLFSEMPGFDMVQVSICGIRKLGSYTVPENNNPVTIYSCVTKEESQNE